MVSSSVSTRKVSLKEWDTLLTGSRLAPCVLWFETRLDGSSLKRYSVESITPPRRDMRSKDDPAAQLVRSEEDSVGMELLVSR